MPPPNTPTDPTAQPRLTPTSSDDSEPRVAKAYPTLFYGLVNAARMSKPLLYLTAISTLIPLRARVALAWQGNVIPWFRVSRTLFWASLIGWMSGRALYVLTILYWWSGGTADDMRRMQREHQDAGRREGP